MHSGKLVRARPSPLLVAGASYIAATAVIICAVILFAHLKPWRFWEIVAIGCLLNIAAFITAYFSIERTRVRVGWWGIIIATTLITAVAYAFVYSGTRAINLRSLDAYIDNDHYPNLDRLARSFRDRHSPELGTLAQIGWPLPTDDELQAQAKAVLEYQFKLDRRFPAVTLPQNLTWTEDPHQDPSWNFQLHNMRYVLALSLQYHRSGELQYLSRAEELVLDWIADNSGYIFAPPTRLVGAITRRPSVC
jgi:hypothetical protein